MGKKKNKVECWFGAHEGKKEKAPKIKNKDHDRDSSSYSRTQSTWSRPKLLRVKPTLSDKDVKQSERIVEQIPKINKELLKNREECNHCQDVMSVAEFREKPNSYVTPLLDQYVEVFGEQNVALCKGCYEVLAKDSQIDLTKTNNAFILIMAAIDHLTANMRMDKKELHRMKEYKETQVKGLYEIIPMLRTLKEKQAEEQKNRPATVDAGGPNSTVVNGGFVAPTKRD